jgi:site-specific DNA-methyltransferase (adenine-specific)
MEYKELKEKYPYYENEFGILFNMDCNIFMNLCEDKKYNLCIVDPPYGIGNFQQSDGNYNIVKWNNEIPKKKYFNELTRISHKQIIWGANYYNCFDKKGGAVIWNKKNHHPSMSQCEIASKSWEKKIDYYEYEWHGYVTCRENKTIHPCQKPVELYKWLLQNYAKPNDKIFDSHVGSASSFIACMELGFNFTGTEKDLDYFEASIKRIKLEEARIKNKYYLPEEKNLFN